MKYEERELQELKHKNSLLDIFQERGFSLVKRGKHFATLCPFHPDKNPSLIITPETNLWNCLGCPSHNGVSGGDVLEFLMKYDKLSFIGAVELLKKRGHYNLSSLAASAAKKKEPSTIKNSFSQKTSVNLQKLLDKVVAFYHSTFNGDRKASDYLVNERGITGTKCFETFKLGYASGTLFKAIPEAGDVVDGLRELGILTDSNHELFQNCIVFPIFDTNGTVVYLYGRKVTDEPVSHLYLPGGHRGVWNQHILKSYDEVILTESIIDSLSLWSAGIKNTIPCYGINGLTDDHIKAFKAHGARSIIILFDGDDGGHSGAEALRDKLKGAFSCRIASLPRGEDPNSFLKKHSPDALEKLIYRSAPKTTAVSTPQPRKLDDGFLLELCQRRYFIKGIDGNHTRLKATIKAQNHKKFHIDTVDLYAAKARRLFIKDAAMLFNVESDVIEHDIERIITAVEKHLASKKNGTEPVLSPMTEQDRKEALSLGRRKNLIGQLIKDISGCGYVGEDMNKLLCYLAMTSRKMESPLSVLIISGSGAGKTRLQDTILSLCPPEDLVKLTSLTGKALFYKKEESLKYKVLAVEEERGAQDADYAIRNLITAKELVIEATVKDMATGKMTTMTNTVKCNTAVFKTTTSPETDPETKTRFIVLSIDESREQTKRILDYQRFMETREGFEAKQEQRAIIKKHQNFQRILQPLLVFNPYAKLLTYLDDRMLVRRDHPKYIQLIKAVTFLHQFQRETRRLRDGREYIEVTLEDIALGNELAHTILGRSLDDLTEPSRRLLELIKDMVDSSPQTQPVHFTRRQIREYTKWSNYQVHTHLKQLIDLEYVIPVAGRNGLQYHYELLYNGESEQGRPFFVGLKDIDQLQKDAQKLGITLNL